MSQDAKRNFEALAANPYPGRGIVIGLDAAGKALLQIYWIMGRSENSRNRVFVADGAGLRTAPANPSKVKDPSLIIYNAMLEEGGHHVVTNGDQTDTIAGALRYGATFAGALRTREYEPDKPNFTPRISGICSPEGEGAWSIALALLKRSPFGEGCDRQFFEIGQLKAGFGYGVTTYSGDGDPLPAFAGEPILLPLAGDADEVADAYWAALNAANRVSLAVKSIDVETGEASIVVRNQYKQK
jgi:hypothetical protein